MNPTATNLEQLNNALSILKILRSNVGQIFVLLADGFTSKHGSDGKETKFLIHLQEVIASVYNNLRDLESSANALNAPPGPFSLGNSDFLSSETALEPQTLYPQLINSYKLTDKIHIYSNYAYALLSQHSLKRSYIRIGSAKRKTAITSCHNVPPVVVDSLISSITRQFHDMKITISRPFATNAVLQVALGNVLRAVIACKGLMIEWVVVKGHGEALDLWTESRHQVFRKVTENSHAATLHFSSPTSPELAVNLFMTWFHSYRTLFSAPCKHCGNHLHSALPPTWRDFRTLEPFHEQCKQI